MKLFIISVFVLLGASHAYAADRSAAFRALTEAEEKLNSFSKIGFSKPAAEILELIQQAKGLNVTNYEAIVGHMNDDGGGAEFGSTSSGWRITGHFAVTPVALSVNISRNQNGNSFVMVHVIFPTPVEAFGIENTDFNVTLMHWVDTRTAQLTVRTPHLGIRDGDWFHEQERIYEFAPQSLFQNSSWNEIPSRLGKTGCSRQLEK